MKSPPLRILTKNETEILKQKEIKFSRSIPDQIRERLHETFARFTIQSETSVYHVKWIGYFDNLTPDKNLIRFTKTSPDNVKLWTPSETSVYHVYQSSSHNLIEFCTFLSIFQPSITLFNCFSKSRVYHTYSSIFEHFHHVSSIHHQYLNRIQNVS